MKYEKVLKDLPIIRGGLEKIETTYKYESKYIGVALGYLALLEDILKDMNTRANDGD